MEVCDNSIPCIGMEFDSVDDVWNFWVQYGIKMGFNVRKHYVNKNKKGEVTSQRFLCAKEGHRVIGPGQNLGKRTRAETRTGCKSRIGFLLIKATHKYRIHDFVSEHNHPLHLPVTSHLLKSQRKLVSESQAMEIGSTAHVGGSTNLGGRRHEPKNIKQQTKEVYSGSVLDTSGSTGVLDSQLDTERIFRDLCLKFFSLASRAAKYEEVTVFLQNKLDVLSDEVDKMLLTMPPEYHGTASLVPDLNSRVHQCSTSVVDNVVLEKEEARKGESDKKLE